MADIVEKVKDAVLPAPTYKTVVKKFKRDEFVKSLVKGDHVMPIKTIDAMGWGIVGGTTQEVEKIEGQVLILKGGKRITSEWFVPEITRRERVRRKADMGTLLTLATQFATRRWAEFKTRLDQEIVTAKAQVKQAEDDLTRAQNRVVQAKEQVVKLEAAKRDDQAWPRTLAVKLMAMVEEGLFTNFEQVKEGDVDVFIIYTGVLWVQPKGGTERSERVRGEYAMKIYPSTGKTRVVVENVMPGKEPGDVPHNENRAGGCNLCFGAQNTEIDTLIRNEEWTRALTAIRVYLEGNRTN